MGEKSTGWAWLFGRLGADRNGDTQVTLADVPGSLVALFFLPGDAALYAVINHAPWLARFVDIGPGDYGGLLSGVISFCVWALVLIAIAMFIEKLRAVDRRATASLSMLTRRAARRLRIAHTLLKQRFAARARSGGDADGYVVSFSSDVDLSSIELRALALHAEIGPGFALPVIDAARGLGLRVRETEDLLARLKSRGLLSRALGGGGGENAYTLAAAGRAMLAMHRLAQPVKG